MNIAQSATNSPRIIFDKLGARNPLALSPSNGLARARRIANVGRKKMPTAAEREAIRHSPITLRIRGGKKCGVSRFGQAAGFFREEKEDWVFRSSLGAGHSITEHMKWMLGMVQHDAAEFKRAQQEGCEIVLQIHSEAADFSLAPEALLLPHKLHLPLEIKLRS